MEATQQSRVLECVLVDIVVEWRCMNSYLYHTDFIATWEINPDLCTDRVAIIYKPKTTLSSILSIYD